MHKEVSVKDVLPNPFRHMNIYPISDEKVDALVESMNRTGFWDNVVARKVGENYELAYGHHRWVAYLRKYGKEGTIKLIIKPLSDADMLHMMADENMAEWGHSALMEQETVRSVVLAYGAGKITLERPANGQGSRGDDIRYAPHFVKGEVPGCSRHFPYTADTVAAFLKWQEKDGRGDIHASPRVRNALVMLEAGERGLVEARDMAGLKSDVAKEVARGAIAIEDSYEAVAAVEERSAPRQAAATRKKGNARARQAVKEALEALREREEARHGFGAHEVSVAMKKHRYKGQSSSNGVARTAPPRVEEFCRDLAGDIRDLLTPEDGRWVKVMELIRYKADIDEDARDIVINALLRLSESCLNIAADLADERRRVLIKRLPAEERQRLLQDLRLAPKIKEKSNE